MEENLGRASAIETGTKLYISNLDYGVSNEDIKVIFTQLPLFGPLSLLPETVITVLCVYSLCVLAYLVINLNYVV